MKLVDTITQKSLHYRTIARIHFETARKLFFEFIAYMQSPRSDVVYASIAYIPFIGWLIPLYVRENSDICQRSAKQGLILSVSAAAVLIGLFFLELFVPSGFKGLMFALIVLTYIFNICYLTLSAYAIYHTAYGRSVTIPWVSKKSENLFL
jgi:hypothetical protein